MLRAVVCASACAEIPPRRRPGLWLGWVPDANQEPPWRIGLRVENSQAAWVVQLERSHAHGMSARGRRQPPHGKQVDRDNRECPQQREQRTRNVVYTPAAGIPKRSDRERQ